MQIILLKDIEKVGYKHDVVKVADGYGRNYLIPQRLAIVANTANLNKLAELKRQDARRESKRLDDYKNIAAQLEGKVLRIGAKAGTSGRIFGSVTNVQLAAALKDQFGFDIERKKFILPEDVKEVGAYVATLNLHPEVKGTLNFEVVSE
jgi:large subunit ribosomal protein L9